jgi:hypothetical protein
LKPIAAALLAAVALAASLAAWNSGTLLDHVLDLRYGKSLPKTHYAPPANRAEANLQDVDYLSRLTTVDISFEPQEEAKFRSAIEGLRARAGTMTPVQFFLGVAEAVALSGNAHTNVDLGAWRERLNSAPVRFAWFADGLYIVRTMVPYVALLGARVASIDGHDPVALVKETGRFIGGTPERNRATSPLLMESPQALHEIHPEAPDDRLQLRVQGADGIERTVELPAVAPADAPRATRPGRLLSADPLAFEPPGEWKTLLQPGAAIPPSLRDTAKATYSTRLGSGDVLYLHLWRVSNGFDPEVGKAIGAAAGDAGDPPWKRIILDLRFNDGGEYPTIYRAIRSLPARLAAGGRLVILTDNTTFSGAIITAALAKHFGAGRASIIGEKQGDRLMFWAEGNDIQLPNSKLTVHTSTGYHDWAHGCRELRCYWPNFYYDVAVGDIDPDVRLGWSFADYRRGIDTVLQRALE